MVGNFEYGVILGMKLMKDLGLDTSVQQQSITWGEELTIPMVPGNYWTEVCLRPFTTVVKETVQDTFFATIKKPSAGLKVTNYSKLDLADIVTTKCRHLIQSQRDQLLAVLQWYEHVFLRKKGIYTGRPCDIVLKKDAKPFWSTPYPIPLKNQVVTEAEVLRQCKIGAMRQLSAEEVDECKWAFPAFSVPKKNGPI